MNTAHHIFPLAINLDLFSRGSTEHYISRGWQYSLWRSGLRVGRSADFADIATLQRWRRISPHSNHW